MGRKRKIINIALYEDSLSDQELLHQIELATISTGKTVSDLIKDCLRKELKLYHTELELRLLKEVKKLEDKLEEQRIKNGELDAFIGVSEEEELMYRDMLDMMLK